MGKDGSEELQMDMVTHQALMYAMRSTTGQWSNTSLGTLPMSSAVQSKDSQARKYLHIHRVREYFYGPIRSVPSLTPHHVHVPPSALHMVRVDYQSESKPEDVTQTGAITSEATQSVESIQEASIVEAPKLWRLVQVTDGNLLVHSVLAVVAVDDADRSDPIKMACATVMGFVYVYVFVNFVIAMQFHSLVENNLNIHSFDSTNI
jgi:hypothetical protein